jgi:RNA polymerase sigma-70 factor (ECF subfamily)
MMLMKKNDDGSAPPGIQQTNREFVLRAFDDYQRKLIAYALKFYGGPKGDLDAANDAVQFTFLKLCQQSPSDLENKLAPWLYTVCRNRIFDDRAKRKSRSTTDQRLGDHQSTELDPAARCQKSDLLRRIPAILHSLVDTEREVVELWSEGLKPKEIAEVLDRPPGTIRVQLHRAIKTLQEHPEVRPWLERATSQSANSVERNPKQQTSKVGK